MTEKVGSGKDREQILASCIALGVLILVVVWSYWNSLSEAAVYWEGAQYSHGYLVPVFTVMLLWLRRKGPIEVSLIENSMEKRILTIAGGLLACAMLLMWLGGSLGMGFLSTVAPLFALAGLLVVVFGAVWIWMHDQASVEVVPGHRWWGVGVLTFGLLARLYCAQFALDIPDMVTFIPSLAGVFLLVGGWRLLRWAGPAVAFLIFMFPLPWSVENALLVPLQGLATKVSTYALQTLGIGAYHEGNRICIGELQMGVVDACSGLRMVTIFIALSAAMVLVTERPWWEQVVILVSAVPIALAVNVMRITVTGILHLTAGTELADMVFHDLAGWIMMPLALGLLWLELMVMGHLYREVGQEGPVTSFGRRI